MRLEGLKELCAECSFW